MTDSPPPIPEFSVPEPPTMGFVNEDALQRFLMIFLESKGHTVHREVPCENGGRIDLLTSLYLIECKRYLSRNALHSAAGQLWVYRQHYPKLQPIIAGLTPKSNQEDAWAAAAKLKETGIQIWFVDRMADVIEFYAQMPPSPLDADDPHADLPEAEGVALASNLPESIPLPTHDSLMPLGNPAPPLLENRRRQRPASAISFEAGCGALIGAGIVLGGFLMLARVFRATPPVQLSATEQIQWADLHAAIPAWDIQTAKETLIPLMKSDDPCIVSFARSFNDSLNADGPEGFRRVNDIKRSVNETESCQLTITSYEFAP
ncbi:MAG: hypothetical protein AAFX95_16360 [Cyanobacteria bacterium J06639_16]